MSTKIKCKRGHEFEEIKKFKLNNIETKCPTCSMKPKIIREFRENLEFEVGSNFDLVKDFVFVNNKIKIYLIICDFTEDIPSDLHVEYKKIIIPLTNKLKGTKNTKLMLYKHWKINTSHLNLKKKENLDEDANYGIFENVCSFNIKEEMIKDEKYVRDIEKDTEDTKKEKEYGTQKDMKYMEKEKEYGTQKDMKYMEKEKEYGTQKDMKHMEKEKEYGTQKDMKYMEKEKEYGTQKDMKHMEKEKEYEIQKDAKYIENEKEYGTQKDVKCMEKEKECDTKNEDLEKKTKNNKNVFLMNLGNSGFKKKEEEAKFIYEEKIKKNGHLKVPIENFNEISFLNKSANKNEGKTKDKNEKKINFIM